MTLIIQSRKTSVNGFMIDGILSSDITPGKKINTSLGLHKVHLENNEIETIETLETVFIVFDCDKLNTYFLTETIVIHPEQ